MTSENNFEKEIEINDIQTREKTIKHIERTIHKPATTDIFRQSKQQLVPFECKFCIINIPNKISFGSVKEEQIENYIIEFEFA